MTPRTPAEHPVLNAATLVAEYEEACHQARSWTQATSCGIGPWVPGRGCEHPRCIERAAHYARHWTIEAVRAARAVEALLTASPAAPEGETPQTVFDAELRDRLLALAASSDDRAQREGATLCGYLRAGCTGQLLVGQTTLAASAALDAAAALKAGAAALATPPAPPAPALEREREAIAAYILSCREQRDTVQAFDVLAKHIREGRHLSPSGPPAPVAESPMVNRYTCAHGVYFRMDCPDCEARRPNQPVEVEASTEEAKASATASAGRRDAMSPAMTPDTRPDVTALVKRFDEFAEAYARDAGEYGGNLESAHVQRKGWDVLFADLRVVLEDEMHRRWRRCVERSDRQSAALEAWNDFMGEQFKDGPESTALHPRAAEIWRQVREALATTSPAPPDDGGPR